MLFLNEILESRYSIWVDSHFSVYCVEKGETQVTTGSNCFWSRMYFPFFILELMFCSSHFSFLVFGHFWWRSYKKIWKCSAIFVYILQGKIGKTEKRKKNHTTKVTKMPKTKRWKYGMNETQEFPNFVNLQCYRNLNAASKIISPHFGRCLYFSIRCSKPVSFPLKYYSRGKKKTHYQHFFFSIFFTRYDTKPDKSWWRKKTCLKASHLKVKFMWCESLIW